jgi:predicted phage tail protein
MSTLKKIAGSGGGGGCFRKDTLIQQENGKQVPIQSLNVGDEVLSFDDKGVIYVSKVTAVHFHEAPEPLINVKFWGGSIDLTSNHWVLNQYGSFVEVGCLTLNDAFTDGMGHLRPLISVSSIPAEPVYNLTVEPNHTFIANDICVHNGGYKNRFPIAGSGGDDGGSGKGGGGSQHIPVESPDSLHSKQFARVIDLISEGEIVGLVDGLKSVYLDNTPVQSSDGTLNFTGMSFAERPGTQTQSYIPGFGTVEAETYVNTEVKFGIPVVRSISSVNSNAVRLTLGFPSMTYQDQSNGDMAGTTIDIKIELQTNSGGFSTVVEDTITGKTTSLYQRNYRVELPSPGPWDIKVSRITANSIQSNLRNESWFASYTELTDTKLRYPNSALIAASIDSSQFKSIPSRGYDIKGLKIRIPSNYDPITRVYTGTWNGTFTVAWTDNPAWCFYDMVTNDRYGLGKFITEDQVDKWPLYTIAQYCDALVNNGFGGSEPRFTCNLYIQTREEAYKVINSMASIFRGLVYWAGGSIVAVQDAPSSPVAIFSPANVIDGQFNYEGTSAKSRHTVVLVSWNDPSDRYKQKIEYVEDTEGIERFGIIQSDLIALGCTSRGQAHRIGKWLLYTERLESEIITFKTGLEGLNINPGQIFKTTDPIRAGTRMGGRVVSATTTSVTADQSIVIVENKVYTLWVALPDGSVESKTVSNGVGTHTALLPVSAYSMPPQAGSMWVLGANDLIPETWRVISITEADKTQATVTALAYREDKFDAVENDLILEPLPTSLLVNNPSNPVSTIKVTETLYLIGIGIVGVKANVSWTPSSTSISYIVRYHKTGENIVEVTSKYNSVDIGPLVEGIYDIDVIAVNSTGKKSSTTSVTSEIFGKLIPPNDVTDFGLLTMNGFAYITWAPASDLDVLVNGFLRVRWTPNILTPTWNNAIDIGGLIAGNATSATLPLLSGTYLAKWVDSSGKESINETGIITDSADLLNTNFVITSTQDSAYTGVRTNLVFDSSLGGLKLDSIETIDGMDIPTVTPIDTWGYIDAIGGIQATGSYEFDNYIDLGASYLSRVTTNVLVETYDANDLIDSRAQFIDLWTGFDGQTLSDLNAKLMVRTTNDDPAGTPTYSAWEPFHVGDWQTRAYQFRFDIVKPLLSTTNIIVKELSVTVDMPDRVYNGENVTSGAGSYAVTFVSEFMSAPSISITAQDLSTGDYYVLSSKTAAGFTITFKNSAGTNVSRTFDWQARGY